jgi:hypothetical protein
MSSASGRSAQFWRAAGRCGAFESVVAVVLIAVIDRLS